MPRPERLSPPSTPAFVSVLAREVEVVLARTIDAEEARWVEVDPRLSIPFAEMRSLVLGGGKRLRPAFCEWGSLAVGECDREVIVRTGAALELLHAFALFHDDIMDGSLTRRGVETTHTKHAAIHRRDRLDGDALRYGDGVGILVGDLTHVCADALMESTSLRVRRLWTELRLEVNIGQFLDIVSSAHRERRLEVARRIYKYKTAKYTVERPMHLGALLTRPDLDEAVLDRLSAVGLPLGEAFQMRDDVLGVFGEPALTGKPVGDDLREGKPTSLLALATERASDVQREILEHVGRPEIDAEAIARVQEVIVDTDALSDTEARIASLTDESIARLDALSLSADVRSRFLDLARVVSWRNL
jgi:geranylgeranyl diphosphate synthase type I